MRLSSWTILLLISNLFNSDILASDFSSPHADNGKLLDFDATNFDAGTLYIGDEVSPYFAFVNRTQHNVRIKAVKANNGSYNAPFRLVKIDTNHVIKPGQRDTIFFKRYFSYSTPKLGNYDLSFTIEFANSDVKQHLNIFCILKENKGEVVMDTVALPTVDIGEEITFSTTVKNTGSDTVTLNIPDDSSFTNYLDQYPIKLAPMSRHTLNFEVNTNSFSNRYDEKIHLKTNVNDKYVMSIPIKGEVLAPNRPDIYFPKKTLRLDLKYGGPAVYNFWYYNTGDMPLIISMCKGSCGCLVPSCSREPLAPGDSAVVKVKYDSKRVGPINKSVTVTSNAVTKRIVLRVTGSVATRPTGNPAPNQIQGQGHNLKFDSKKLTIDYRFNEQKSAVFKFTNEGVDPVKIHIPRFPGATIVRHSENSIPRGGRGWISVKYDSKRIGEFTRNITVGINGVYYSDFLELSGVVGDENESIHLGPIISFDRTKVDTVIENGADATFIFHYTNIGDEPLIISKVISCIPVIEFHTDPTLPGEHGVVILKHNLKRSHNFNYTITLIHNASNSLHTLRIKGTDLRKPIVKGKEVNYETLKGPQITFETDSIYREMEFSGDGNHTFTNTGDADLFITLLKPSGSMVAHCTREAIKPCEIGVIFVKYNTRRYGPFRKTITVNHNAGDGRSKLTFVGSVTKEIDTILIDPQINSDTLLVQNEANLSFETPFVERNFQLNEKVVIRFDCYNFGNALVQISKVIADDGGQVQYLVTTMGGGQRGAFQITYPTNKIGPFNRTIVVYHTGSVAPIVLKFKGVIL